MDFSARTTTKDAARTRRRGPVRHRAPLRLYTARKTQPFSMHPPPAVKTAEQQAIQTLHRVRTQWQATRTARINVMRGVLREFGLPLGAGARTELQRIPALLDDAAVD